MLGAKRIARWRGLRKFEKRAEIPMLLLALAWLALMVVEFVSGLSPALAIVSYVIWAIFILEFVVRFAIAPKKRLFLLKSWLTLISLVLPALRIFRMLRILRFARAARGIQMVRVVGSLNRGIRALGQTMVRRGFAYVGLLSVLVAFGGAAGMFTFERGNSGFTDYWESLWWTSMVLTTLGSETWPRSGEGRALMFLIALYGFSVFGYLAATLASYFVEVDKHEQPTEELARLRSEVQELVALLRAKEGPVERQA